MDIDLKQQFDDPIGKLTGLNDAAMLEEEKFDGREVDEEYELPSTNATRSSGTGLSTGHTGPAALACALTS